jgi:hypothetical protein
MDDNNPTALRESQFEWAAYLVNTLHPHIFDGVWSIYQEAEKICKDADEPEKYLMTFQNFLARIPKWNPEIIQTEVSRIVEKSRCTYINDLLTCVHIVHLKILTAIRPSKTQKKINIDIPSMNPFIHKVYILLSRVLYENIYLFEQGVPPLVFQKNRREINTIIKTAILDAVRDSIPVAQLLKTYLDESTEIVKDDIRQPEVKPEEAEKPEKVTEEVKVSDGVNAVTVEDVKEVKVEDVEDVKVEDVKVEDVKVEDVKVDDVKVEDDKNKHLSFSDVDYAVTTDNRKETIDAPKDLDTLQEISEKRYAARKAEEDDTIQISNEVVDDPGLAIEVIS